ncbi:unnamed protein product [Adineta steineri]|uniref:EF-hand domain-containing protein n=1 Tax=Adineta steineri TaxID=433720 RepID=A0A814NJB9_9BILA|nr:unnamed protein product [Adineta steineri]CAF1093063.1 unnamed protein product [Adineta steineri]
MMQEIFNDENNRSLNYTKIDRCQDNICINNDEYYKQIIHSNEHNNSDQDLNIKILLTNRFRLILFIFLFLTTHTNALPAYPTQMNYNQPSVPVQLNDRSIYPTQQTFKVYRRFPTQIQQQQQQFNNIPSYSNAAIVQVHSQQNPTIYVQNSNEQQYTLQLRRERQRRAMIDRMVTLFDEDGNGQLTKDELYSMALRSNAFPRFHSYLKQTST